MEIDAAMLARVQFAFTISFHIIFPAFTIGLSAYIAMLHLLWLKTGQDKFATLARFWTKIFAVSFAMGVVSGIVLSYQFGTNWSRFSHVVGNVLGPLLGYEVLTAFFLEATFLGIMLFGWNRVAPWLQALASVVVAFGTATSAFWILSANSWMQFPTGHEVRDGIAYPVDWLADRVQPDLPAAPRAHADGRLPHHRVRRARDRRAPSHAQQPPRGSAHHDADGAAMIFVTAPLQLLIGDEHGRDTAKYQPAKLAAMEAHWDGSKPGALVLFAIPDATEERNDYEISIPCGASLIVSAIRTDASKASRTSRTTDARRCSPFFWFRVMVGIGFFMMRGASRRRGCGGVATCSIAWFLHAHRRRSHGRSGSSPSSPDGSSPKSAASRGSQRAFCAPQTRFRRSCSQRSPTSLALFVIVYGIVFTAGIRLINKLINKGPVDLPLHAPAELGGRRPITGAVARTGG